MSQINHELRVVFQVGVLIHKLEISVEKSSERVVAENAYKSGTHECKMRTSEALETWLFQKH